MSTTRGKLLAVEGVDGSGKSGITKMIVDQFRNYYTMDVVATREVGGTPIAEQLRNLSFVTREDDPVDPMTRLLMVLAARNQHYHQVIEPALAAGKLVITDRYNPSTLALQGGVDGLSKQIEALHDLSFLKHIGAPAHLHVFLDVDATTAYNRGAARRNVDNDAYKKDLDKAIANHTAYRTLFSPHEDTSHHITYGVPYTPFRMQDTVVIALDVNTFDKIEHRVAMACMWLQRLLTPSYYNHVSGYAKSAK